MDKKGDKLCAYVGQLINSIYCGRVMNTDCKDCIETYNQLIDGLKKIGFTFEFNSENEVKLEDIKL